MLTQIQLALIKSASKKKILSHIFKPKSVKKVAPKVSKMPRRPSSPPTPSLPPAQAPGFGQVIWNTHAATPRVAPPTGPTMAQTLFNTHGALSAPPPPPPPRGVLGGIYDKARGAPGKAVDYAKGAPGKAWNYAKTHKGTVAAGAGGAGAVLGGDALLESIATPEQKALADKFSGGVRYDNPSAEKVAEPGEDGGESLQSLYDQLSSAGVPHAVGGAGAGYLLADALGIPTWAGAAGGGLAGYLAQDKINNAMQHYFGK